MRSAIAAWLLLGCPVGIGVDLWTHEGIGHVPVYEPAFKDTLWTWLLDHARP